MDMFLLLALGTFLLAGTVKGTVGMGLPITAIGILSQFTDPRFAVTISVLPIVVSNAWQVFRSGDVIAAIKRYWRFALCLAVVLLGTSLVATRVPTELIATALGFIIVLFALTSLAFTPPFLPEKYDRIGQIIGGTFSGIFGGLTAIWAPPMVIYFLARRLDKDEFVRASGVLFLAGSLPLLVGYFFNGLLDTETTKLSALLIIPSLLGFTFGELLRRKLNTERFRTVVLIVFLVMGLNLLRRSLF